MKILKILTYIVIIITAFGCHSMEAADSQTQNLVSTKKERNHITKGNDLYKEGKYRDALNQYRLALDENPASIVARYNLGLSQIQIGSNPNDTTKAAKNSMEAGVKDMQSIANLGPQRPMLASRANYNLGNVAFNSQDFGGAIDYYKQALRLNPNDNDARRNLRIAQLKEQQNQDQDQDQDQNEQEDNQDKEQNQDQNQDQQDQQDQNQDQNQQQNQPAGIDQQTAEQILNAMENKENQTRSRLAGANAEKSRQRNRNRLNW